MTKLSFTITKLDLTRVLTSMTRVSSKKKTGSKPVTRRPTFKNRRNKTV